MLIPLLGTSREKYYRSPRSSGIPQARVSRARTFATLGFFNSIDSKLPKLRSFKLPEFIQQIKDTFAEYHGTRAIPSTPLLTPSVACSIASLRLADRMTLSCRTARNRSKSEHEMCGSGTGLGYLSLVILLRRDVCMFPLKYREEVCAILRPLVASKQPN